MSQQYRLMDAVNLPRLSDRKGSRDAGTLEEEDYVFLGESSVEVHLSTETGDILFRPIRPLQLRAVRSPDGSPRQRDQSNKGPEYNHTSIPDDLDWYNWALDMNTPSPNPDTGGAPRAPTRPRADTPSPSAPADEPLVETPPPGYVGEAIYYEAGAGAQFPPQVFRGHYLFGLYNSGRRTVNGRPTGPREPQGPPMCVTSTKVVMAFMVALSLASFGLGFLAGSETAHANWEASASQFAQGTVCFPRGSWQLARPDTEVHVAIKSSKPCVTPGHPMWVILEQNPIHPDTLKRILRETSLMVPQRDHIAEMVCCSAVEAKASQPQGMEDAKDTHHRQWPDNLSR